MKDGKSAENGGFIRVQILCGLETCLDDKTENKIVSTCSPSGLKLSSSDSETPIVYGLLIVRI